MIYNKLGKSGIEISALSFGAMRFKDEKSAYQIINRGIDAGINYVDTSSGYCDRQSEEWVANAIKHRREEIYYSTKSFWAKAPSAINVLKAIENVLKNTGLDYLDFWQIWGLDSKEAVDGVLAPGGTMEGIEKAKEMGILKQGLGFTFHGTPDVFKYAVDSGAFLCATVSYNVMNREAEELINYAAQKGLGVIIMNPLGGGLLGFADDPKLDFLKKENSNETAYGALRFLYANKNITTSICGFSYVEEIDKNVAALKGIEGLDEKYRENIIQTSDNVELSMEGFCTYCKYCDLCPNGVRPFDFMKTLRDFRRYSGKEERLVDWFESNHIFKKELNKCTKCGKCEKACPQKLPIVKEIVYVREAMEKAGH